METINKLEPIPSPAPIDKALWDAGDVGAFLRVAREQVLNRYSPMPTFPRPVRLPVPSGGLGHPRWWAREVIQWAEGHQR